MKEAQINSYIGARLAEAREQAKLTQNQCGAAMGVSFQQYQKFEKGNNRIAACQLFNVATAMRRPVSFFLPKQG